MTNLPLEADEPEHIDPEHLADVIESLAQARRGEFATDAEIVAAFRLFGASSFDLHNDA